MKEMDKSECQQKAKGCVLLSKLSACFKERQPLWLCCGPLWAWNYRFMVMRNSALVRTLRSRLLRSSMDSTTFMSLSTRRSL